MPNSLLSGVGVVAAVVAVTAGWLSLRAERLAEAPKASRRRRGLATGSVLAVATVAGAVGLGAGQLTATMLGLLVIALALGAVGLLGDRRRLPPSQRMAAEALAGALAAVVGLRSPLTGTSVTNVVVVVVFVVVVVESLRLLDAAPRAAAATVAPAVASLAVLAIGSGQTAVAVVAMAMAGGLVGLLIAGTRRAFWLGESGCLFCGLLLAGLVIAVNPRTMAPSSVGVLLPLLAIPLVNAAVVVVDRLRRQRPLTQRRPDGIPHRLKALRLPWPVALAVLGGASAAVGIAVVAADRRAVPLAVPAVMAAGSALVLLAAARSGQVHRHKAAGLTRGARLAGLGVVALLGIVVLPAALALVTARADVLDGALSAEQGLGTARNGEVEAAGAAFARAQGSFTSADDRLGGPLVSLGLAVPILGPNLSAARTLTSLGTELASTGGAVATSAPKGLAVTGGAVPLEEIRRLSPGLDEAAQVLRRADNAAGGLDRSYLLPQLREKLASFDDRLGKATGDAEVAAQAAAVLPGILGGDGPRRYFLAVQNNAELRGTGGFIGNYGELVAEGGRLRLERIGRIAELNQGGPPVKNLDAPPDYLARYTRFDVASTWQSVNLSPDLPTVGRVIAGLYPQSGGGPIDGVIVIDPVGLAGILSLTGAVEVEPWPEPITAGNVAAVTLNQAYIDFEDNDDRIDFVGDVAETVAGAFTTADLGSPSRIFDGLGQPARGGHLAAWFTRPEEQALVERVEVASQLQPVKVDSLAVVNQNAGGNKIDYYLRRSTSYDVELRPDGDRLQVSGRLRVAMENQAPAEGLPSYIIGPFDARFQAGENRTYVSVYTPLDFTSATVDGQPVALEAEEELGRKVYSAFLSIPARSTRTLEMDLQGSATPLPGGWYELDLLHQPLLVPGDVTVSVEAPEGWRIAEAQGATIEDDHRAVANQRLDQDKRLRIRLVPSG